MKFIFSLDRPTGRFFDSGVTIDNTRTKRDEILDVACDLFYEQGYHQTGIHQIIQKANTAKGTFYSHFPSKEHLGVCWLKMRHKEWMGWLLNGIAQETSARNKLIGIFQFLENWMIESDYRGCAFINTLCETPQQDSLLRKETSEHKRSLVVLIESLLFEMDPDQAEKHRIEKAQMLFLLIEGTIVSMQNFRENWPAKMAKDQAKVIIR